MKFETLGPRLLVAGIFIPLVLLASYRGGLLFVALVSIIVVFSTIEFFDLVRRKVTNPQAVLGSVASLAVCLLLYLKGPDALWWFIPFFSLAVISIELFRREVAPILNVATTVFGLCYVPLLFGHMILIRELPTVVGHPYYESGRWIILMFLTVWGCDTAAYAVGTVLGKHKLYERISPNKTWEGAIAGFVFALLCAAACHVLFVDGLRLLDSLVIGAVCGSFGQISDLVESQFKRDAMVKDSSGLIPGHGGMLDRFDSLVVIAPLVYYYLRYVALV